MHNRYKLITKMTADKAKLFLLEPESFFNLSLPPYFNFEKVINDVEGALGGNPLSSYYNPGYRPEQFEHVNYHLYNNKDGKYAWRRHQIIHPAIYVDLVNTITETSNWNAIISRFNEFKKNNKISCISIPKKSLTKKSSTAESILEWWKEIEQESLKKALDYKHIMVTDISNCYSSIYTHSIAWALHTKKVAKANKTNRSLLGNIIDKSIQSMQYGQTNGIPEGSVLMDFIAEMVLGYADELLTEKLKEEKIKDYHILRFRDDYRIFANDSSIISRIGKHLSEVLIELNLKLNSSKTFVSNDLISSAFKSDKLDWNAYKQTIDKEIIDKKNSMHQKQLLLIYSFAEKYPNSGSIMKALNKHYEKILKFDKQPQDIEQCVSIVVEIAIKNPKVYAICSAIIGKYLGLIKSTKKAEQIANKVYKRISEQPNANYVDIWLYRAIFKVLPNKIDNFKSSLELYGETKNIWDSSWVNSGSNLYNVLQNSKIIDDEIKDAVEKYIDPKEINLFVY